MPSHTPAERSKRTRILTQARPGGIPIKEGAFRAQAQRAGFSTAAFARRVLANKEQFSGTTVRRAVLAQTLMRLGRRRRAT